MMMMNATEGCKELQTCIEKLQWQLRNCALTPNQIEKKEKKINALRKQIKHSLHWPIVAEIKMYSSCSGWVFGAVMCKVTPFMQGVAVSASVSTLAAISLDRYLAICYTLEFRMTRKTARIAILFIWTGAVALMTLWAIYYHHHPAIETSVQTIYVCEQQWPSKTQEKAYFLGAIFIACYSIPLIMITICYALIARRVWNRDAPGIANTSAAVLKSKIKVLKMLVVVVVLFVTSWLPVYAIQIRIYFGSPLDPSSMEFYWLTQIIVPVAQWWGSANSCVNPIIYCLFSKKFRQGFTVIVHCCKRTKGTKTHWMRNSSLMYRSVCNQEGSTLYTHIENRLAERRLAQKNDITEEQTCF